MKLISMTDFILEQSKRIAIDITFMEYSEIIIKYANFLKQPLELWMFVPCDENGNVLEEPEPHYTTSSFDDFPEPCYDELKCKQYQQAKERCLFDGFTNSDEKEKSFVFTVNGEGGFWIPKDDTIEGLMSNFIPDYIKLTQTAIKQLSL